MPERPIPSLLRNFSAPVIIDFRYSDRELAFLSSNDADGFNRWEAGQRLATARLLRRTDAVEGGRAPDSLDDDFVEALRAILVDDALSPAFKEQALTLPAESFVGEQRAVVDPQAIRVARRGVMRELGRRLADEWKQAYATQPRRASTRRRRYPPASARCATWRSTTWSKATSRARSTWRASSSRTPPT